jgi:hypothetical protein
MDLLKKYSFLTMVFLWLGCKLSPEKHIPQRIYGPCQTYNRGDFYITNDILYADGSMKTTIGGDLSILSTISGELKKHPKVVINIIPPKEGPFAPAFSHSVWFARVMVLRELLTEKRNDPDGIKWELDTLSPDIIGDGDYHVLETTVFVIERGDAKGDSYPRPLRGH